MHGLGEIVGALRLPTFAHWRWSTLHEVLRSLRPCLQSLSQRFDATLFAPGRDTTGLALVTAAFRSEEWHRQGEFVWHFTHELDQLMQWGTGSR